MKTPEEHYADISAAMGALRASCYTVGKPHPQELNRMANMLSNIGVQGVRTAMAQAWLRGWNDHARYAPYYPPKDYPEAPTNPYQPPQAEKEPRT